METTYFDYEGFFIFLGIVGVIFLFIYIIMRLHNHWIKTDPEYKELAERKRSEYKAKQSHRRLTGFHTYKYRGPTD